MASDLDLTAAIEAAAEAVQDAPIPADYTPDPGDPWPMRRWADTGDSEREYLRALVRPGVEAAAPLIEAAVRERIVAAFDAWHQEECAGNTSDSCETCRAYKELRTIARGGAG